MCVLGVRRWCKALKQHRTRTRTRAHTKIRTLDVVQGQIQIFEVLHVVQVFHSRDDVVLEVQDLEFAAGRAKDLTYALELLLCAGVCVCVWREGWLGREVGCGRISVCVWPGGWVGGRGRA